MINKQPFSIALWAIEPLIGEDANAIPGADASGRQRSRITFFWRFAALEAALIADPKFRKVRKQNLAPDPGWDKFKKALEGNLHAWDSQSFREAATALLECNVRRQVVRGDDVTWEALTPSDSPAGFTIDTLICVRNTLFHGGKFSGGAMDIARDKRVLHASLNVLNECYELHHGIRSVVDDVAQAA